MPLRADGSRPDDRNDRVHADKAWVRYEAYRAGHLSGAAYVLPQANPFATWDINQRYAKQAHFDESCVAGHRDGTMAIRRRISEAHMDGLLP